jgi:hypothetical protein
MLNLENAKQHRIFVAPNSAPGVRNGTLGGDSVLARAADRIAECEVTATFIGLWRRSRSPNHCGQSGHHHRTRGYKKTAGPERIRPACVH